MRLALLALVFLLPSICLAEPDAGVGPAPAPGPNVGVVPSGAVASQAPRVAGSAPGSNVTVAGPGDEVVELRVERTRGALAGADPVLEQAVTVIKDAKDLGVTGPTVVGIATLIAALVGFGITLARRYGAKLLTQNQINYAGIVLAAIATGATAIASAYVPGMEWWKVIIIGASPLMTTLGHGDKA